MKKLKSFLETNKITSFFLNRDNFALIYITTCILWFFPMLGWLMDPICKICFAWGAVLVLWDLLTQRRTFKSVYWAFPILIILAFGITVLINIKYCFYMGIKHIIYSGISLLILYGQDREKTFDDLKKILYRINCVIIGTTFIAVIVSLFMFIFQVSFTFRDLRQGFVQNRLFGVFTSPNTGALFTILSFAAMLMNSIIKRDGKIHFGRFFIVNSIVLAIYFSLTLSKGGLLTLISFELLFVIFYFVPKLRLKLNTIKSLLAGLLVAVVLILGSDGIINAVRYGMAYIPQYVNMGVQQVKNHFNNETTEPGNESEEPVELNRTETGGDTSNGRLQIWSGGIKFWLKNPLFGYGQMMTSKDEPGKFDVNILSYGEKYWVYKIQGNLHNAYIQVLVYSGIVGLLLVCAFGILILKKSLLVLVKARKDTWQYGLLAIMFVTILSICANGMVESHLLYNRQDPFGVIFWFYAGTMTILAEQYSRSDRSAKENVPNQVFICDTPYQVMVSIALAKTICDEKSDIYVVKKFKNADEIVNNLKSSSIFSSVMGINPYKVYPSIFQKAVTVIRILNPYGTLKKYAEKGAEIHFYDKVYLSFFTPVSDSVKLINSGAEFIQYEDGIGSYSIKDLEGFVRSGIFNFINKFFLNDKLSYSINKLYLNHPECYSGDITVEKIPPFSDYVVLKDIFNYSPNSIYRENRVIYLTQPLEETEIGDKAVEVREKILSVVRDKAVLRLHPRQAQMSFDGCTTDNANNLWELECAETITDEHILLGAFSTAQFTPKMLFDKEPTVVFLYKLFGSIDGFKNADETVKMLRKMYRCPEKVIVVDSMEQLKTIQGLKN